MLAVQRCVGRTVPPHSPPFPPQAQLPALLETIKKEDVTLFEKTITQQAGLRGGSGKGVGSREELAKRFFPQMREDKENLGNQPLVVQIIITHLYYLYNVFLGYLFGVAFFIS